MNLEPNGFALTRKYGDPNGLTCRRRLKRVANYGTAVITIKAVLNNVLNYFQKL